MNNTDKSKIILNNLADTVLNLDWNLEDMFLKQIKKSLDLIDEMELKEEF